MASTVNYASKQHAQEERISTLQAKREGATGARAKQLDDKLAQARATLGRIQTKASGVKAPTVAPPPKATKSTRKRG